MSRYPLFQVMFAYQRDTLSCTRFRGISSANGCRATMAHPSLICPCRMTEAGDTLRGSFEFATSLFTHQHIRQMKYHWLHLLAALGSDPGQTVWQLPLFDQDERARLLNDPLASTRNFPLEERLDQLIARQARLQPNRSAILFGDNVISFGELEAQANQLAHYLKSLGVRMAQQSASAWTGHRNWSSRCWAVLKAGGACLPLDPRYPADRLRFMLEDARTRGCPPC